MTYARSNQQIYPAKGRGDWMSVKGHEKHVVISPSASNDKCWSAQWDSRYDGGSDWAVALYECAVTKFKRDAIVEERDVEMEERDFDGELEERSEEDSLDLEKRWSRQGPVRNAKQCGFFFNSSGCTPGSCLHY